MGLDSLQDYVNAKAITMVALRAFHESAEPGFAAERLRYLTPKQREWLADFRDRVSLDRSGRPDYTGVSDEDLDRVDAIRKVLTLPESFVDGTAPMAAAAADFRDVLTSDQTIRFGAYVWRCGGEGRAFHLNVLANDEIDDLAELVEIIESGCPRPINLAGYRIKEKARITARKAKIEGDLR